ncbi:MAG TPA: hypothetical protein VD908_06865 [Cytophagales bacterium]|nr:hypothetical protein [Cytophagales bacterium]
MWAQILNVLNGILLMTLPWLLKLDKGASNNYHIVGPLIAMFALTAIFECTRNVRWFNIPLGGWLVISPLFLNYNTTLDVLSTVLIGVLVVALSLVRGKLKHQFAGGWRGLFNDRMSELENE